jgi:hypothetical protein
MIDNGLLAKRVHIMTFERILSFIMAEIQFSFVKVKDEVVSKNEEDDVGPGSDLHITNDQVYCEVTPCHSHLL